MKRDHYGAAFNIVRLPWIFCQPNAISSTLKRGRGREKNQSEDAVTKEEDMERGHGAGFEGGGRGHKPRSVGSLQKLEEPRKPWSLQKESVLCSLILAQ